MLGFQWFQSHGCGKVEPWKRASPCKITNHCDRKTRELPSCCVNCNMTLPCWHTENLSLSESVYRQSGIGRKVFRRPH